MTRPTWSLVVESDELKTSEPIRLRVKVQRVGSEKRRIDTSQRIVVDLDQLFRHLRAEESTVIGNGVDLIELVLPEC